MGQIYEQINVGLDESLEEKLQLLSPGFADFRILRKSVDARGAAPKWTYSVEVFKQGETVTPKSWHFEKKKISTPFLPVNIVGAGPAGLFAALRLVEYGVPCRLFEQGSRATQRMRGIVDYWRYGRLHPMNNVAYGEGGAGLYSDGKLITRIKSPHIPYVLNRLVQFGAPAEIEYVANPHVGSDRIRKVIPPLREFLIQNGCEIYFDTKVASLIYGTKSVEGVRLADGREFKGSATILATGHSAEDMLMHLHENGVFLEGKSFAVGLRIEHPQTAINRIQYKAYATHPALGAANYRLADHDAKSGIGVYSFCMCPGGYIISSGTEQGGIVSNGMSNYARNSPFANAAVVVGVDHQTRFGNDLFGGLKFRRQLEQLAWKSVVEKKGDRQFPAQRVVDFMEGRPGATLATSSPSGVVSTRLDEILPQDIRDRLRRSMERFDRKMHGFLSPQAQFHGVETRTSCPVRVTRDTETLQSISHANLYPTGEGAGYAGGITSAAVDGVRVAEAILQNIF